VKVFDTADGERVVSVEHIPDEGGDDEEGDVVIDVQDDDQDNGDQGDGDTPEA
jgi:DNA gyrase subunit A